MNKRIYLLVVSIFLISIFSALGQIGQYTNCYDFDNGQNYASSGYLTLGGPNASSFNAFDYCFRESTGANNKLTSCSGSDCKVGEYFCTQRDDGTWTYSISEQSCVSLGYVGCEGGRCVNSFTPAQATCTDGIKNQDETDVDCGGAYCSDCAAGKSCTSSVDCLSTICSDHVCLPGTSPANQTSCIDNDGGDNRYLKGFATGYNSDNHKTVTWGDHCSDGSGASMTDGNYLYEVVCQNNEVKYIHDIPCTCHLGACQNTTVCTDSDGGENRYIKGYATGFNSENNRIVTWGDHCSDRTGASMTDGNYLYEAVCKNNEVTYVHEIPCVCHNGACEQTTTNSQSCTDGIKNGDEERIDCGGAYCPICRISPPLTNLPDCVYFCDRYVTRDPEYFRICREMCYDNFEEANETGPKNAACDNRKKDGMETDIDCGGNCRSCANNKECSDDSDCQSGFCSDGVCKQRAASCSDGRMDEDEEGVDCGGRYCKMCRIPPPTDNYGNCVFHCDEYKSSDPEYFTQCREICSRINLPNSTTEALDYEKRCPEIYDVCTITFEDSYDFEQCMIKNCVKKTALPEPKFSECRESCAAKFPDDSAAAQKCVIQTCIVTASDGRSDYDKCKDACSKAYKTDSNSYGKCVSEKCSGKNTCPVCPACLASGVECENSEYRCNVFSETVYICSYGKWKPDKDYDGYCESKTKKPEAVTGGNWPSFNLFTFIRGIFGGKKEAYALCKDSCNEVSAADKPECLKECEMIV